MDMDKGEFLEIEKYHTKDIDGNVLANALRFVLYWLMHYVLYFYALVWTRKTLSDYK